MKSSRLFRSLTNLALIAAMMPLGGCIINVLPEIESDTGSTGEPGTSGDDPTTGASATTATTDTPTTGGPGDDGGAPTTGEPGDPTGAGGECDFAGEIQPIFTASCAGCHGGGQPAQSLSLAEGAAYAALVEVDSVGMPGTLRVAPGDPASSFLVHKL
ncbi:MAG TPA: hypothetical protein VGB85_19540, partial [Nannocystis sp.]